MGRANSLRRAAPCPRAASSHCLGALGTCTSPAMLAALELLFPLCPRVPSAVARFCCSSFSLRRVPEPRLSPAGVLSQVLSRSITAHVVFMAASSLRWGFAGLAWLLSRLQCGMAAGSGRLFSAAHMENTLSNHKEWRWHLKKTQIKVVSRGLTGWRQRSCLA